MHNMHDAHMNKWGSICDFYGGCTQNGLAFNPSQDAP